MSQSDWPAVLAAALEDAGVASYDASRMDALHKIIASNSLHQEPLAFAQSMVYAIASAAVATAPITRHDHETADHGAGVGNVGSAGTGTGIGAGDGTLLSILSPPMPHLASAFWSHLPVAVACSSAVASLLSRRALTASDLHTLMAHVVHISSCQSDSQWLVCAAMHWLVTRNMVGVDDDADDAIVHALLSHTAKVLETNGGGLSGEFIVLAS